MTKRYEGSRVRRNRGRWAVLATAAMAAAVPTSQAQAGSRGATERVSVATSGAEGSGGTVPASSISDDGRYVAFHSRAEGLVPNDTNNREDVFVHDRSTGSTSRVSVSASGAQGNGPSLFPELSGDGRYVVFGSGAPNLVPGDTNANPPANTASPEAVGRDVFVHDRVTGAITRESVAADGGEGACFTSAGARVACGGGVALAEADINLDGRFVAFAANGQNLVPGDTNNTTDVFVRDRQTGTTTRISVAAGGAQGNGASAEPSISADGRFVAFSSLATNLVADDTNGQRDVFVHDRQTGTMSRVSVVTGGGQGCTGTPTGTPPQPVCAPATTGAGASSLPSISDDGNVVAFFSQASLFSADDTNTEPDVFVHDRTTTTTTRVSVPTGGGLSNSGSFFPSLSGNGRFIAFDSLASNLVAGDTNAASDVFVHDRQTATTTRASLSRDLAQANAGSFFPSINADGRFLSFSSQANNLVAGDTNTAPDVFVHDRTLPTPFSSGYRLVASDGGIFAFGDAPFFGSTGALRLNRPVVGMASTPRNRGYWLVASDGGIFAFGDAGFHGSTGALRLAQPIVGMAATPTGAGYWLVASDGGIFAFGDARFFGSTGALRLNRPIVGMAATPTGRGYFLVASDGGIFAFGDAVFRGSTGAIPLNQPIVGMAATPTGNGYYLVASDGGIFAFGDAVFRGSTGAIKLNQPMVGMAVNPSGRGYWMVARDGGIFAFGDAGFAGSTGAIRLNQPINGMAAA